MQGDSRGCREVIELTWVKPRRETEGADNVKYRVEIGDEGW